MARFTATGAVLGLRETPYDFTDETGKRNAGTSRRLLIFDHEAVLTHELSVREVDVPAASRLTVGEVVTVEVDVRANKDRLQLSFAGVRAESTSKGVRSA